MVTREQHLPPVNHISSPDRLLTIWERALGARFRSLPCDRQEAVILAIGCDEALSCPLVEAYGVSQIVGNWTSEEECAMAPYGVTFEAYSRFLAWNDTASEAEVAQCRVWLETQQEVATTLRRINPDMDEAAFQYWLTTVLRTEQEETNA